jgi:hypothetical protein
MPATVHGRDMACRLWGEVGGVAILMDVSAFFLMINLGNIYHHFYNIKY